MTCSRAVLVAVLAVALASCGGGGPPLHPVRGSVLFDGQPAEGASVVFQPVDGKTPADQSMPSGVVGSDGGFTLHTHPHGAGAPPGEYVVLVTWYPPNSREQSNPKNKLPDRYAKAGSPLKATVKPGDNALEPFKLTK